MRINMTKVRHTFQSDPKLEVFSVPNFRTEINEGRSYEKANIYNPTLTAEVCAE